MRTSLEVTERGKLGTFLMSITAAHFFGQSWGIESRPEVLLFMALGMVALCVAPFLHLSSQYDDEGRKSLAYLTLLLGLLFLAVALVLGFRRPQAIFFP